MIADPRRRRVPRPRVRPVTYRQAREFITDHHRHLTPPQGHKFSLGLTNPAGDLLGVAVVGRPVARHLDDGLTAEITRLATDGSRNACSVLLAAAWRVARHMGYQRMITYTRSGEPGTSLRAAGWTAVADLPATPGWDRPSRPRTSHEADGVARTWWQVTTSDWAGVVRRPPRRPRRQGGETG
ncbi:XF1762 family protein [Polymorphospora sp. NPDC050346]|uniref:XF1762 family protein n=1 Tax=Polymorphospora sp. NPDC050346 TaxID=3155780 RepID=UPI0033E8765B